MNGSPPKGPDIPLPQRQSPAIGLILDLDDTLVAAGPTWTRAETRLFELLGSTYSSTVAATYKGLNVCGVAEAICRHANVPEFSAHECGILLRSFLLEEIRCREPVLMPGAREFMTQVCPAFSSAVASGSPREVIDELMKRLEWSGSIDAMVSSEEVAQGKPAPDVFLKAAKVMSVAPERCVVVEDSLNGVEAAKRAGMACIAIPVHAYPGIEKLADLVVGSLADVTVSVIEKLVRPGVLSPSH